MSSTDKVNQRIGEVALFEPFLEKVIEIVLNEKESLTYSAIGFDIQNNGAFASFDTQTPRELTIQFTTRDHCVFLMKVKKFVGASFRNGQILHKEYAGLILVTPQQAMLNITCAAFLANLTNFIAHATTGAEFKLDESITIAREFPQFCIKSQIKSELDAFSQLWRANTPNSRQSITSQLTKEIIYSSNGNIILLFTQAQEEIIVTTVIVSGTESEPIIKYGRVTGDLCTINPVLLKDILTYYE